MRRRQFLNALLVLALFTAGISPVCSFISGRSSLQELCTIEAAKVAAVDTSPRGPLKHKSAPVCLFCSTAASLKLAKAPPPLVTVPTVSGGWQIASGATASFTYDLTRIPFPRGPPGDQNA